MVEGCSFGKGIRELLSKKRASEQTPEEVRKPSTGAPSRPALDLAVGSMSTDAPRQEEELKA